MRFNYLKSKGLLYALLFLPVIFYSRSASAQERTVVVRGIVRNNNSEALPGVSVVLRNTKTNFTSGTSTDASGVFSFSRIPPGGPYSFAFSTVGYEAQTLSGYTLKEDAKLSLEVN